MIFEELTLGSYNMNCYIVASEKTKEAAIIDPGFDFKKIDTKIKELGLEPKMVIITHAHGDHIGAVQEIKDNYDVKVYIHEDDADALNNAELNLSKVVTGKNVEIIADVLLKDLDKIKLSDLEFEIIHTPGHTRGGMCIKIENIMITGDTLFNRSVGRTDLPGGSFEDIISSIKNKIFKYSDDIIVYPGHGSPSTIGSEKRENPFVN